MVLFYGPEDLSIEQKEIIIKNLYLDIVNKNYYPSIPRKLIYKEKAKGVPRVIPVFEIKDYCLYYFCIKKIEDKIAKNRTPNTFGGWSLGGKIRQNEDEEINMLENIIHNFEDEMANYYDISVSEYSFNPKAWSKAYGDFNGKLKSTIESGNYTFCVEFDIANFYDCINLNLLEIYIREIGENNDSEIISVLFHFLQYWNRKNNHYNKSTVGIPQDALGDCSRILANYYLQKYDSYVYDLCGDDFKYFRYADDQFIFGNNIDELEEKIFKVGIFLNKLGLSINQKKVEYWQVEKLLEYRSYNLFDIISEDSISNDNIEKFISEIVMLYKQNGHEKLKSKGLSLLNKAIILNLNNVNLGDKLYLKSLFLDENYLKQAKPYQFGYIYNLLEENEKENFIKLLYNIAEKYKYNQFHYSVLQFFENQKLDKNFILGKINELEKFYLTK
ncbi:MAG: reverse transcriptase domain-containing protein [Candidatus Gracilibacteria bacterium]|nr:reverse transcriptase domain-containing protein [Candidatus Gracilibacteria bacterium]